MCGCGVVAGVRVSYYEFRWVIMSLYDGEVCAAKALSLNSLNPL